MPTKYGNEDRTERRARKRVEAEVRQAAHDKLTIEEKIAKLKRRRGDSAKERARLEAQLEATDGTS